MSESIVVGSLYNLAGPDLIAIFLVLAFWAVPIAAVVVLIRWLKRRSGRHAPTPGQRLQTLESLRQSGAITEDEYREQRQRIVSEV